MIQFSLYKVVNKLTSFIFRIKDHSTLKKFFKLVTHLLKHNGTLYTIVYMKQVRLHITRYMVGKPLMINSNRVSLTSGFPTRFLFLKKYIDSGNICQIKFVLTLMNISKCILPKKDEEFPISYDSITNPFNKPREYTVPAWFIRE
jgi:hypothetical protein